VTRVAAVDCGTNSVRLLVSDLGKDLGSGAVDVVRRMEIVRLGEGVDRTGRLSAAALERTRVALADYAAQVAALGVDRLRMVATSATRDAANANEFHDMVVATLGVPPQVLTGDEEARLSFVGAVRGLPASMSSPYLVVDIGGGSTEFVVGQDSVEDAISVDIGCVRMTERHLHDDPPTPDQIAAAQADVETTVDRAVSQVKAERAGTLVGLAGSVTTVAALALGLDEYQPERIHHARVSFAEVERITTMLLGMSSAQRLTLPVMHPGRADVIAAGSMILRAVMARVGAETVVASEHDILDGICASLVA
jgi:exopolyphosphatase / guanosine-5'-triphosphate,3'-diphosphate pyrophosphatase